MALSICKPMATDERGRELVEHGTPAFPLACYNDDIQGLCVDWHWHEELEALVVETGVARVCINGQSLLVPEGSGVFINAGALHGVWDGAEGPCKLRSLVFHPRLVGGSRDSVFWANYLTPLVTDPGRAWLLLTPDIPWEAEAIGAILAAWECCVGENGGFEFAVRHHLSRLTLLLTENTPGSGAEPGEKLRRDGERAKEMLRFLQEHWAEPVTLADVAASAAISENECLRCFRSILGTSPIQYLKTLRIQRAAELLVTTDRKVGDIGGECGFQEMSYFAKTFRQQMGCTPSRYRKTYGRSGGGY